MNPCDCITTIFEARNYRSCFARFLAAAVTIGAVAVAASISAQPIKVAYAALVAGQIPVWIAKEGAYLSKHGIDADLIYIPATAATQALIANEIQLAQVTGVSTAGAILSGAEVRSEEHTSELQSPYVI